MRYRHIHAFVEQKYKDSLIQFAYDVPLNDSIDVYFDLLGGSSFYPRTIIVDGRGVITFAKDSAVTYDQLVTQVEKAMGK